MTQLSISMSSPEEALRGLDKRTIGKVAIRAVNKTLAKAKTAAGKMIRQRYFLKAGDMRRVISLYKATPVRPVALMRAKSPRLALPKFRVRQKAKGVQVRVLRSSGGKVIPGTFLATMRSGHEGVFQRIDKVTGSGRQAISELSGPSPAELIASTKIFPRLRKKIQEELAPIYNRELGHELKRQASRRAR